MVSRQPEIFKGAGRYDAFRLNWHPVYDKEPEVWPIADHLFWDSDIGKWVEGACYFLQGQAEPNSVIDGAVKELVEMIRTAQAPDGYLNIHYQVVEPGHRFTNLRDMHEMYNLRHLIEGALAHHQYYKNELFLAPMLKYVELLHATFGSGDGQIHGYPGHPELEPALLRLYHRTGSCEAFDLARYFFKREEIQMVSTVVHSTPLRQNYAMKTLISNLFGVLHHDTTGIKRLNDFIVEQPTIEGHSVREMYLLTAVADLVRIDPSIPKLKNALRRLWNNMVEKKMYATGGIGSIKQWEGFGQEYFLPQGTDEGECYAETCASIGLGNMLWCDTNSSKYDLNNRYSDIIELCLYNAVFTAVSIDCKSFTYVNQLASSEHNSAMRSSWFTVACCPPNVLRLLGMFGGYIWDVTESTKDCQVQINLHLFTSSSLKFGSGAGEKTLTQKTKWPLDGKVQFNLTSPSKGVRLMVRVPGWATSWTVTAPLRNNYCITQGYLLIPADYLAESPTFIIDFPLQPRLITSHPLSSQKALTLARGPVVYCVEDKDNDWVTDHFRSTYLDPYCIVNGAYPEERKVEASLLGEEYIGISVNKATHLADFEKIQTNAFAEKRSIDEVLREAKLIETLNFVPYYFRANRGGKGMARVGLKEWFR